MPELVDCSVVFQGGTTMNRVSLRVFCPPDSELEDVGPSEPVKVESEHIIPFDRARRCVVFSGRFMPAVDRARLIHDNCECPDCHRRDVEPMELNDATISQRSRLPVPGTATIIGFHCNGCGSEWPVYELSRRSV